MCSLLVRSFYKGKGWKKLLKMLLSAWHPPPSLNEIREVYYNSIKNPKKKPYSSLFV